VFVLYNIERHCVCIAQCRGALCVCTSQLEKQCVCNAQSIEPLFFVYYTV